MSDESYKKQGRPPTERSGPTQLLQCAELLLPWLTDTELASVSSTCKSLLSISRSITTRRSLDASRSLEKHPVPFHNPLTNPPYHYFLYTVSSHVASSFPLRQPWGGFEAEGGGSKLEETGIGVKLKVVRDVNKGWGLFADQFIAKRRFICEYAGELVTTEEARRRQKIYDELTRSSSSSSGGGGGFCPALLVVREHLPSGKACLRINIDATKMGNVARFINHSCDGGNLSTVLLRSSQPLVPRLCFFASRDIDEGEELTFSYGEIRVRSTGLKCYCGSTCCFGTLPSEDT